MKPWGGAHPCRYLSIYQMPEIVIIDGEIVMPDGQSTEVSREGMKKQPTEQFSRPLETRTLEARQKVRQLLTYVGQFYQSWRHKAAP